MRAYYKKYSLLIWLFLIFVAGTAALILTSAPSSSSHNERANLEQLLNLSSEQVLNDLGKEINLITNDIKLPEPSPAMREWLLNAEQEAAPIAAELQDIQKKLPGFSSSTAFLVATERTQLLDFHGVPRQLDQHNPADHWIFKSINDPNSPIKSIEVDLANRDYVNIFISQQLLNDEGKAVGLFAIRAQSDRLKRLLDTLQNKYHRLLYLSDDNGNLVFANDSIKRLRDKLLSTAGIQQVAASVLANKQSALQLTEFKENDHTVLLASQYFPSLGLHLLLEQPITAEPTALLSPIQMTLAVCAAMAILSLTLVFVRLYQLHRRLDQSAATDQLTTLLNRQAFDFVFNQAMTESERSRLPLCVALIDIDLFKQVNKKNGHLLGDHILKEIAMITRRSLRESDIICRWGGEEFLILLKNCSLEKATSIAENLRQTIANNDFSRTTDLTKKRISVTVSMGVAECKIGEKDDSVFERAEIALKQAKENGRNGVYFAE